MTIGHPSREAASSLRWGVAGCGKISDDFATAMRLAPDAELVACAATDAARAAAFGAKHGIAPAKCYDTYAQLANDAEVRRVS